MTIYLSAYLFMYIILLRTETKNAKEMELAMLTIYLSTYLSLSLYLSIYLYDYIILFRTETKNAKEMELALLTAQREKLEKAKDMKEQLAITRYMVVVYV